MTVSPQLVRASKIMACLSLVGAVIAPAVVIGCFLFPSGTRALDIHFGHLGAELVDSVPLQYRLAALVFALIPTGIASWGLVVLARLFRCYARGEVFTAVPLKALSQVTAALFWNVLAAFLTQAPISLLLTYYLGHGHREISLSLGSDDVQVLFVAGVTYVIARVMGEARRLADENEGFV
ncbi:MAG TPA: DUF2975 domain-containing protein [Rhizomicrobium sp.]|jgi:hypothetical protein